MKMPQVQIFERFVVTTSHKPRRKQIEIAKKLSKDLGVDYVPRRALSEIMKKGEVDFYYVVERDGRIVIRWKEGEFFFHPATAKVRMRNLNAGGKDYLIESLKLEGYETVLDVTFGLGAEAILIAHFLPKGKVIGLEKSIHVYRVVRWGIENYVSKTDWINDALKRITVINADFREYIKDLKDDSVDVVYCDPMFENPVYESNSINPIRPFASYDTLDKDDLKEMLRVAKKRVVIKSHIKDTLFKKLGIEKFTGSKGSGVIYATIEKLQPSCLCD